MWAERGAYLMMHVFGDKHGRSGMPPGLIAEFYWNFGTAGVIAGMFFMGMLFRQVYVIFAPYRGNPTCVVIYTVIVTRLTIFSIGNDFGTGFLKVGLDLVPLVAMLFFFGIHVPENDKGPVDAYDHFTESRKKSTDTPRLIDLPHEIRS